MLSWIINNKQWVFSGIGIFVINLIFVFLIRFNSKANNSGQRIFGDRNIQVGGDLIISNNGNRAKKVSIRLVLLGITLCAIDIVIACYFVDRYTHEIYYGNIVPNNSEMQDLQFSDIKLVKGNDIIGRDGEINGKEITLIDTMDYSSSKKLFDNNDLPNYGKLINGGIGGEIFHIKTKYGKAISGNGKVILIKGVISLDILTFTNTEALFIRCVDDHDNIFAEYEIAVPYGWTGFVSPSITVHNEKNSSHDLILENSIDVDIDINGGDYYRYAIYHHDSKYLYSYLSPNAEEYTFRCGDILSCDPIASIYREKITSDQHNMDFTMGFNYFHDFEAGKNTKDWIIAKGGQTRSILEGLE